MPSDYKAKRNFKKTPEPAPKSRSKQRKTKPKRLFVVQKHEASHLHYDFRIQIEGVLKSWAVPKGPSLNPADKRLAIQVEDHPYEYHAFEGIIPEGNYGAGTVMIWDKGLFEPVSKQKDEEAFLQEGLRKGRLELILHGEKLKGAFALIRMHVEDEKHWLLIKKKDSYAKRGDVTSKNRSVKTGRSMEEIAQGKKLLYKLK